MAVDLLWFLKEGFTVTHLNENKIMKWLIFWTAVKDTKVEMILAVK